MSDRTEKANRGSWLPFFLAALVAVLATILSSATASAATQGVAETRVRASAAVVEVLVGQPEHIAAGQRLGNEPVQVITAVATGVAAETAPSFVASADGVVVPTSRARLVEGFEGAGFPKTPTTSPGTQYTLPDGTLVRVMEPSGQAPLRASFTNANGGPISPFTGKPIQPPPGLSPAQRLEYIRMRTHVELGP